MNRFWFYLPIPVALLFVLIAFYIHPFAGYPSEEDSSAELFGMIFIAVALVDIAFVYKTFIPKVLSASAEKEAESKGLVCISSSEVPMMLGFVHYFMFSSVYFFGALLFIGFLSWLVFYKKIIEKLSAVQQ